MDIVNPKSATTLLVCCLFGVGFLMDAGPRREPADSAPPPQAAPAAVPAPGFATMTQGQETPQALPGYADLPDDPVRATPPQGTAPAIVTPRGDAVPGEGVRLPSAPLAPDRQAAAKEALAEDLGAMLP